MLQKIISKLLYLFLLLVALFSCSKGGGVAPGSTIAAIVPPKLVSILVTPANQYVAKSSNFQLQVTGLYDDGVSRAVTQGVTWVVDDTSIASVSATGLLSNTWAGGANNATRILNVSASVSTFSASTQVTIVSASVSSLIINPANLTVAPGATVNFVVYANMSDGSTLDVTSSATASFSNAGVATVSNGVITGVAVGAGTLTVNYGAYSQNTAVTVSNGASSGGSTTGTGLKGDYYDGRNFDTFFGSRTDATINFNWNADVNNLGQSDEFSIRWTGFIQAEKTETYTFYTRADDGTRLSINGSTFAACIDDFNLHGATDRTCATTFALTAGQKVAITLEYFEGPGVSVIGLYWSSATTPKQIIPQQFLYEP
jgi:plastocyanin